MEKVKACKIYWFNHSGKLQHTIFESEKVGFDWLERYGVEYFDHLQIMTYPEMIEKLF